MTPREKWTLWAPFIRWFGKSKERRDLFQKTGLSLDIYHRMMRGSCSDRVLLANAEAFEKATGISVDQAFIRGAKVSLWGQKDKLPAIVTRDSLVKGLEVIAAKSLDKVAGIIKTDGPRDFQKFLSGRNKWGFVRVKHILTAVAEFENAIGQVSPQDFPTQIKKESVVIVDNSAKSNNSQRTADSIISILNSLANMADANIDGDSISVSTKINAASAVVRMLEKLGVSPATLKAFEENRGGTDTTNLKHVLNLLGRK